MGASLNKWFGMGNATRDVELKYTQSKTAFCNFSIAVNDRFKNNAGEWTDKVTYIDVTAFGRTAEVAGQYVKQGTQLHIEGRLELDQWEDKNGGGKRSKLKVVVDRLQLLGQPGGGGQQTKSSQQSRPAQRQNSASSQAYGSGDYGTEASGEPPSQEGLEDVPW